MTTTSIYRRDKRDSACEVGAEVRMRSAVLRLRAVADAVRQRCLEAVEVVTDHVRAFVHHHPCQMLPHALPHDARLAMVHPKPFFEQDGCYMNREALRPFLKLFVAGKCQIIGEARVLGAR